MLVVWNNALRNRWPLDVAFSADGCRTWSTPRTLADTPGIESSYPTATQLPDGTIVVIWNESLDTDFRELRIARFNRAWLRGGTPQ